MNRLRLWILGSAVGCFCAGMSTGLVFPSVLSACCGSDAAVDADESYVRRFAVDFDLTAEQQRQLRIVVQRRRAEELSIVRNAGFAELPPAMQAQWSAAQGRERMRVRALLDDAQRARYDREVALDGGK